MKSLFMISPYIDQLLNGEKNYDARSYDTWIRGTIALVQSKTNLVLGTIELVEIKEISFQEYMEWHDERYKQYNCIPASKFEGKKYYAWIMKNPKALKIPFKIIRPKGKQWTEIDDNQIII